MQHVYVECCLCEFTVELTANQLHAQSAGFATHYRDNAYVLGDDWRVKQVGLGAVIVHIPNKYLQKREKLTKSIKCPNNHHNNNNTCWFKKQFLIQQINMI